MFSVGAGFGLLILAIYVLFFSETGWLRFVGGAYITLFFVVCIIDALRRPDPLVHLVVPGLIAVLMVIASSIRSKWKNWP
jgi:hypothetical protein